MSDLPHDSISTTPIRLRFRGAPYVLHVITPAEVSRLFGSEVSRTFSPEKWVLGLSVADAAAPDFPLGFYAISWSTDCDRFDDIEAYIRPSARGRHLSHLLVYGVYLKLLDLEQPFRVCEVIDHPKLRLHARCGFAPPVRQLVEGKVELGRFDLHTVLSRLESEDRIEVLG